METADQEFATEVVSYLLSSFPQQAPDPEIYGSQLIALCTGRPKSLLQQMVNPIGGLVGEARFLPTIADVKKWFDRHELPHSVQLAIANERQTLREREETEQWKKNRGPREDRVLVARQMRAKFRGELV